MTTNRKQWAALAGGEFRWISWPPRHTLKLWRQQDQDLVTAMMKRKITAFRIVGENKYCWKVGKLKTGKISKLNEWWISEFKTPYLGIFCFSKDRKYQTNLNAQTQHQNVYNESGGGWHRDDDEEVEESSLDLNVHGDEHLSRGGVMQPLLWGSVLKLPWN